MDGVSALSRDCKAGARACKAVAVCVGVVCDSRADANAHKAVVVWVELACDGGAGAKARKCMVRLVSAIAWDDSEEVGVSKAGERCLKSSCCIRVSLDLRESVQIHCWVGYSESQSIQITRMVYEVTRIKV